MSVTDNVPAPEIAGTLDRRLPAEVPPGRDDDQVLMTGVGLSIPADLSFEGWERAGRQLSGIVDSSSWWLGDWLVYGKKRYTDRYRRAIRAAGLQYQTLRNYAWVARRFDLGRRRAGLSFQHHAEVASLPVEEQDFWLDRAEEAMWTTKQLRSRIRDERLESGGERKQQSASVIPRIEVPDNRLVWWRRAADLSGVEFDNWVMAMLDRAAEQVLSDEVSAETWRFPAVAANRLA
ncbi:LmbU family transcriptional regulator [Amycolatopsis sp. NPDC059021]|uniref:LmbU family transcriptional regulator n=1 Tax=Amycolatopsis sp. NPDC059021 TaxID=3346704 RepID=UPI00366F26CB